MAQYRLKAEVVEAVQFTGDPAQAEQLFVAMFTNVFPEMDHSADPPVWTGNMIVVTAEGEQQRVQNPDWILTRADNSRFRVFNDDFQALYEEVPIIT